MITAEMIKNGIGFMNNKKKIKKITKIISVIMAIKGIRH
jgi:hypothetical protein